MPLTPEQLATFIRLQGAAQEIQASARAVTSREHTRLAHIGEHLRGVLSEARSATRDDPSLSAEFDRLFGEDAEIFWRDVEPRASALFGWLGGAIAAESLQMRIDADAREYAAARIREERRVGFGH
jgi:hypothetical protein